MSYTISNKMKDMKGSAIREIFKNAGDPSFISLAGGNPAPETFPNKELAEIAADLLTNNPVAALQYGVTEGIPELRSAVRARLGKKHHIGTANDDLIIVSGGQQGVELMTKVLINEGDTVIVEEPSFIGALNAFRSYGAHLAGVPVWNHGMDITELEATIKRNKNVRFIYTIPNSQNPAGITMSVGKRRAIFEIAKKYGLLIIEDDPYGEISFEDEYVPPIKSFDTDGDTVIYCGSFSKILAPGLRIGFCMGPSELIAKAVIAKQVADVHTPCLTQLLALEYMRRYDMDANIAKSRELYAHKCNYMLDCIKKYFPKSVTHTTPSGGLFIWCDIGKGYDAKDLAAMCAERKVVFVPGSTFMVDMDAPCSGFRLNYSTMSDEKIEAGIKVIGECLYELLGK